MPNTQKTSKVIITKTRKRVKKSNTSTFDKTICFYFQVHQPYRLRHYNFMEIGKHHEYFDQEKNEQIFRKVAEKCYLPANHTLLKLLDRHPEMRLSFSLSGVFLEQCEAWGNDVIESFQKLVETGQVEILAETYYHSLSFLYSKLEFSEQVRMHRKMVKKHFGVLPKVFRNTELIYTNELGNFIQEMGFKGIIAEGADHVLKGETPNHLYHIKEHELSTGLKKIAHKYAVSKVKREEPMKMLLKNYRLSDDIAFRFSNKGWAGYPLTAEKFAHWVAENTGETINLFMDYETFGEHQWEDTGIFDFLMHLPSELLKRRVGFRTPSETIKDIEARGVMDMHEPVSWADMERDLSAWLGNEIQEAALKEIYNIEHHLRTIEPKLRQNHKTELFDIWRKLQTSDQFYYMCTKYWSDGDVHKYFSPYESPYDAYITFMNTLQDFSIRLQSYQLQKRKPKK